MPTATPTMPKPPGKLGAEKLTPKEQKRRFIEAAREAGASENVDDFRAALRKIAKPKVEPKPKLPIDQSSVERLVAAHHRR